MSEALEYFKLVYDQVPGWVQKMHDFSPNVLEYYTKLRSEIMIDGAISKKDKDLIIVGINAARNYERSMIYHTKGALDSGSTIQEVAEIIAASTVLRGLTVLLEGVKAISYAEAYTSKDTNDNVDEQRFKVSEKAEDAVAYFIEATGTIPSIAEELKKLVQGGSVEKDIVLKDGALSRKVKELLLVGISISDLDGVKVKAQMESARKAGSTEAEIADVGFACLLTAGIPAWFEASDWLSK
jgi:alkylhydroperoxidase/carboxymuconolactone decarboxylase family protein YurZ